MINNDQSDFNISINLQIRFNPKSWFPTAPSTLLSKLSKNLIYWQRVIWLVKSFLFSRMYRSRMRFVTQSLLRPRVWLGSSNQIAESSLIKFNSRNISTTNDLFKPRTFKEQMKKKKLSSKEYKQEVQRYERAALEGRFRISYNRWLINYDS